MPRGKRASVELVKRVAHPKDREVDLEVPKEDRLGGLREALSNPMDLRTPDELCQDYGIELKEFRKLQADPRFMGPVTGMFTRALGGAHLFILKKVFRQVEDGNVAAAKLALQSLSGDFGGVKLNVFNIGGNGQQDPNDAISKMSDVELDAEIHRLMVDIVPPDMEFDVNGNPIPLEDAEVVDG